MKKKIDVEELDDIALFWLVIYAFENHGDKIVSSVQNRV